MEKGAEKYLPHEWKQHYPGHMPQPALQWEACHHGRDDPSYRDNLA